MAIRRFSNSSIATGAKSSKLWDGETFLDYYDSIATTVLSSATGTVTFSNIPQIYKHLHLRILSRSADAGTGQSDLFIICNQDRNANYSSHRFVGNGTTTFTGAFPDINAARFDENITRNGNLANAYSGIIVEFLDYSNTSTFKTMRAMGGTEYNGGGTVGITSSNWRNTAAISRIDVENSGGNFLANSHFALYGILGA